MKAIDIERDGEQLECRQHIGPHARSRPMPRNYADEMQNLWRRRYADDIRSISTEKLCACFC